MKLIENITKQIRLFQQVLSSMKNLFMKKQGGEEL
jgi:hypothetical protein